MSNKKRLLIIGLDGATFDIIDPLREKGHLPALGYLLENGAWNRLYSTTPPATFPAWTTFMTGKNPGKHGIFDFTERIAGTYKLRFLNATFRRAKSIWQILSESGLRVGVMGVPATYPPEKINGFMISGFDSPVAGNIDPSFVKPAQLYDEIKTAFSDFRISDLLENFMDESWYPGAREKILSSLESKARAAMYLYRKEPWDCFMVLFGESDTVSHHFWKFYDTLSPRYEKDEGGLATAIQDVYRALDGIIKKFMENLWDNTSILIVSDHGFGGVGDKALSLNKRLEQEGFLHFRRRTPLTDSGLGLIKDAGLKYLPQRFQEMVFRSPFRTIAQRMEASSRFSGIEWDKTAAFSEELNNFPSIHINLKGREPQGTVSAGTEYERTRDKIIKNVLQWKNVETGKSIVRHACKREDVYAGDYVDLAPDIILDFNSDNGYSYLCLSHRHFLSKEAFKKLSREESAGVRLLSMSGSHRPDGIFILSGDALSFSGKTAEKTTIQDICPTILSFFEIPVDPEMDGNILNISKDQPAEILAPRPENKKMQTIPYTEEQEKKVAERLKNLGYFD